MKGHLEHCVGRGRQVSGEGFGVAKDEGEMESPASLEEKIAVQALVKRVEDKFDILRKEYLAWLDDADNTLQFCGQSTSAVVSRKSADSVNTTSSSSSGQSSVMTVEAQELMSKLLNSGSI